jgi:hypothetical protein
MESKGIHFFYYYYSYDVVLVNLSEFLIHQWLEGYGR